MYMFTIKEVVYVETLPTNVVCVLGADIGGTNSNFGVFQLIGARPLLLLSLHVKSKEVTHFPDLVIAILTLLKEKYSISILHACIAAAGVILRNRTWCKPTNLPFIIDIQEVKQLTNLSYLVLANDFEVIGYGLPAINQKDLVLVNNGIELPHANKAIVGAGTGLGKVILLWSIHHNRYVPVASEGGHADFVPQTQEELELTQFIKQSEQWHCNISWEDVLSGNGISRIYRYFRAKHNHIAANKSLEVNGGPHPDEIFKSRLLDKHAWNTFVWYSLFYARCAKNFALESLALGGIYIAGGIAAKNLELFQQKEFMQEFYNCGKQQHLLAQIPIYVITDYNVSLHGAVYYLLYQEIEELVA